MSPCSQEIPDSSDIYASHLPPYWATPSIERTSSVLAHYGSSMSRSTVDDVLVTVTAAITDLIKFAPSFRRYLYLSPINVHMCTLGLPPTNLRRYCTYVILCHTNLFVRDMNSWFPHIRHC